MRAGFTTNPEITELFTYMRMASEYHIRPDEVDKMDCVLVDKWILATAESDRKVK